MLAWDAVAVSRDKDKIMLDKVVENGNKESQSKVRKKEGREKREKRVKTERDRIIQLRLESESRYDVHTCNNFRLE